MASKGGRGSITWEANSLLPRVLGLDKLIEARVGAVMDHFAAQMQASARSNAPWNDRTTNARNGLFAKQVHDSNEWSIVLHHTVPYGVWLETRWNGKYAIIMPTINTYSPMVMKALSSVLNISGGGA
jgi:hypothetical protein